MNLAKTAKQIAADPEAQYQALQRSLRRRKGFGLLFIQASPAKAQELLQRLQKDLPQKTIGTLTLTEPITNLYNLVAERPDLADLNILFIQGIEKSLEPDIKPGYGGEGDYYNLDTVPPLLSHLNQQRDNFRDHFGHLCFVFVVPPFALKYLIRRAADFLDWRSAIFTFADVHSEKHQIQPQIAQIEVIENIDWCLIHFFEGNAKYESGDYEEAITYYDAVLELEPDNYAVFNNKGNALANAGQYESAIACYDTALEIKPDFHEAFFNKGNALLKWGKYDAAITIFDAILAVKPDFREVLCGKGIALRNLEQCKAAITCFDDALAIKSDDQIGIFNVYNKGIALINLGQYKAAITCFDDAITLKPDYHEAIYGKGIALSSLGQYEAATNCFDIVLEIKPGDYGSLFHKGNALFNLGQYEAAITAYDQALAIKSNDHKMGASHLWRKYKYSGLTRMREWKETKPWTQPNNENSNTTSEKWPSSSKTTHQRRNCKTLRASS